MEAGGVHGMLATRGDRAKRQKGQHVIEGEIDRATGRNSPSHGPPQQLHAQLKPAGPSGENNTTVQCIGGDM